jgi:hypothetical protein
MSRTRALVRALLAAVVAAAPAAGGCRAKASATQCDQLLEHYALLVVTEKFPDGSTALIETERERERNEARGDDAFKNCSSQVSEAEFRCAIAARSADAFEKCLE